MLEIVLWATMPAGGALHLALRRVGIVPAKGAGFERWASVVIIDDHAITFFRMAMSILSETAPRLKLEFPLSNRFLANQ